MMRIMIGPWEVAGIGAGLKAGFDRLGREAELVLSHPHPFGYGGESRHLIARIWLRLGRLYVRHANGPLPVRLLASTPWRAWSVLILLWALIRYDAFIFLYGTTITNSRIEARLYAWTGKRVALIYCGSDARPAYVDGPAVNLPALRSRLSRMTRIKRRRIALYESLGFVLVNSPTSAQLHAKPFVNWFITGIPRDFAPGAEPAPPEPERLTGSPVRILHSPSAPLEKGTARIVETVEKLKGEGLDLDFVLLQGVPNSRVKEELGRCDFVIDQLYSDQPLATFAVEAAHFGRPAVVGGYAAAPEHRAAFEPLPPSMFVVPDELEAAVRLMATDAEARRELGARAREFVGARWSIEAAAGTVFELLRSGPRPDQLVDPAAIRYVHGCGLPEEAARSAVREVVARGGPAALQLSHNPALEQAFVRFSLGEDEGKG
jgi:glycosyltransferase involved in cell wall biosynthesis